MRPDLELDLALGHLSYELADPRPGRGPPTYTEVSSASLPDSEHSLTDDSVDTASEEEKITSEMIQRSHEHTAE